MVGAALIAAFACPAQPAILVDRRPGVVRTTAVACDGDRRVVVRRARQRRGRAGERIVAVAGAGRWVAWGLVRRARRQVDVVVGTSRLAGGRARRKGQSVVTKVKEAPAAFDLLVTSRGQPAWLVERRVYARSWLTVGASVPESRTAAGPLALEDDRTMRWWEPDGLLGFKELPRDGFTPCGRRPGYRLLAEGERVVVIEAVYDERVRVLRACERYESGDPVIAQVRVDPRERLEVLGFRDRHVVLKRTTGPEGACETAAIELRTVRYSWANDHPVTPCGRAPDRSAPLVIANSRPVWIVDGPGGAALYATAAGRTLELDATGPGGITGLTADLGTARWLRDGEPRLVTFRP